MSDDYTQIAIQGPKGAATLQKLTDADLSQVKFYWFTHGMVCGLKNILMARTGYTAERPIVFRTAGNSAGNRRLSVRERIAATDDELRAFTVQRGGDTA